MLTTGCGAPPAAPIEQPIVATPEPSEAPAETTEPPTLGSLDDPPDGMTLRLPALGTSKDAIVERVPECADADPCRFHGRIAPLTANCEDGCTWWTYRFADGLLREASLLRAEVDVDAQWAAKLIEDAEQVADALQARIGRPPDEDTRAWTWAELETRPEGTALELRRKVWDEVGRRVTWSVTGRWVHHPIVELRVVVDDELRVLWADPTASLGAPLLELRGGPLLQPFEAPLWLELDTTASDKCDVQNDALAFTLTDGRVYLAQFNPYCGGQACRIIDVRTGEASAPKACLFGDGIHHAVEPIGEGFYLLTSTSEGAGTLSIEAYDPDVGTRRVLEMALSAFAEIETDIEDGAVTFTTRCELPQGCASRSYERRPLRRWRWTVDDELQPTP